MADGETPPPNGSDADFEAPNPGGDEAETIEGETGEDQGQENGQEPEAPAEEEREIARVLLGDEQFKELETSVDDLRDQYVMNQESLLMKALRFVGRQKKKDFQELEKRFKAELIQLHEQKVLREARDKQPGLLNENGQVDVESEEYLKLYQEKRIALAFEESVEQNKIAAELASKSKMHKTLEWIKKHPGVLIGSGILLSGVPVLGSALIYAGLALEVNKKVIWPIRDKLDVAKTEVELAKMMNGMIETSVTEDGNIEITPNQKLSDLIIRNIKRKETDGKRKELHKRIIETAQEEIDKKIGGLIRNSVEMPAEVGETTPEGGEAVPGTENTTPETRGENATEQTITPEVRLKLAMEVFDSILANLNEADKRTIINRDRLWTAAAAASGLLAGEAGNAIIELFININ